MLLQLVKVKLSPTCRQCGTIPSIWLLHLSAATDKSKWVNNATVCQPVSSYQSSSNLTVSKLIIRGLPRTSARHHYSRVRQSLSGLTHSWSTKKAHPLNQQRALVKTAKSPNSSIHYSMYHKSRTIKIIIVISFSNSHLLSKSIRYLATMFTLKNSWRCLGCRGAISATVKR